MMKKNPSLRFLRCLYFEHTHSIQIPVFLRMRNQVQKPRQVVKVLHFKYNQLE